MREKIDEEVSVVMFYSAQQRRALLHTISWQNKDYTVKDLGYHHSYYEGKVLYHIFELTVKEADLWMRLNLNTKNLHWTLEAVSDGLAN